MAFLTISLSAQSQSESAMADSPKQRITEKYIQALFRDLYHRDGSTQEVKRWTRDLTKKKLTKEEVAQNFLSSEEYRTQIIISIYLWYHNRKPTEIELPQTVEFLKNHPETDVIRQLVLSEEFWENSNRSNRGWVENLYWTIIGRHPDGGGLNYWTSQIESGMTKESLVNVFFKGREYRFRVIDVLYNQYLHRLAEQSEREYWTAQMEVLYEWQIVQSLLTGDEYWKLVTK